MTLATDLIFNFRQYAKRSLTFMTAPSGLIKQSTTTLMTCGRPNKEKTYLKVRNYFRQKWLQHKFVGIK